MVRKDQPDAREGQAGPCGVADRLVVPLKPSNAGGGKGPDFGNGLEAGRIGRVTMLSMTSKKRFGSAEGSSGGGEGAVSCRHVCRQANPVGEPDAGNLPVRFDEREVETGLAKRHGKLVTRMGQRPLRAFSAQPPRYLSTLQRPCRQLL